MTAFLLALILAIRVVLAGTLTVEVLDVGQGDAILIRSPGGKVVLVDAGPPGAGIVGMLRRRGIERIDLLVATHAHADHIGGMPAVLQNFEVRRFGDSGQPHTTRVYDRTMRLVEEEGIPYRVMRRGQRYNLDDRAWIEVLSPGDRPFSGTRSDLNSNSVVLRLQHGRTCVLLPGDAEAPTEQFLLREGLEPCEGLKVAHHGGAHSTTQAFLDALRPRYAAISVGAGNRYHHPRPETLDRLEAAGVEVHRTDLEGTITFVSTRRKLRVTAAPEPGRAALAGATVSRGPGGRRLLGGPPRRGAGAADVPEPGAATADAGATPAAEAPDGGALNLNRADLAALDTLPGIGPTKARAFLSWRESHGPCTDLEELDAVPGFGPGTIRSLRGLAVCGPAAESAP